MVSVEIGSQYIKSFLFSDLFQVMIAILLLRQKSSPSQLIEFSSHLCDINASYITNNDPHISSSTYNILYYL